MYNGWYTSGAFSMFTQGIEISLDSYAEFIHKNQDIIHIASNLDDTSKNEQKSYDNQKALESLGVKVQPVFHAREDPKWLIKYLEAGYDYIFLGGMVPETAQWLKVWLDDIWDRYLTNPDGTPKVKIHGFGLTTFELMYRYPWFSVDSTSWVMTSRMGGIMLDMPHRVVKLDFSDRSPAKRDLNSWHYDTLPEPMQKEIEKRLGELGYEVEKLRTMYGWRDHANITFYERLMNRTELFAKTFKKKERGLFDDFTA